MTSNKKIHSSAPPAHESMPLVKIGELLIKEGLVKEEDIKKVLSIQEKEKEFAKLPLGEILVKMGLLSMQDLESALNHPSLRKNIGSLAVEKGLLSIEDLELCLKKKPPAQLIGEALVDFKILTRNDIGYLLKEQINSPKLGSVLIDLKLISDTDLQAALKKQKTSRALGEILCDIKKITPQNLNRVLEKYNKHTELDEILIKHGYIDNARLLDAKKEQRQTSEPLEKTLIRKRYLNSEQLHSALAKKYNLPYLQLRDFAYSESQKKILTNLISQKYAEKNLVLPLNLTDKNLDIAIFKPELMYITNELNNLYPNLNISVSFITEEKFEEIFEILYSNKISSAGLQENEKTVEPDEDIDFMEIDLSENIDKSENSSPAYGARDLETEELTNLIVKYGILNNASDIHIEQDRLGPKLRYRIDGILQEANVKWLKHKLPDKIGSIISRIKVMSNLDITENRMPQDGVFRINYYDKASNKKFDLDFRVATCCGIVGENITIRILDSRKANVGLDNLGHSPHVLTPFKKLLRSSSGMVLVSGPTGSGKSSSLYGALRFIYSPGIKIITAEDPIEYSFPGIMQTQINPKIGLTFSRLLKSFLRLDPDAILVGELHDKKTASIGFDAAQTGHLLLSTIHTDDSISAVSQLVDLGIEYGQIASCLLAVLSQRLVKKICPFCKREYVPDEEEWSMLFDSYPSHLKFHTGDGCESCNFSGYKGRLLISEIFVVDREIGTALSNGLNEAGLNKIALESGMRTMLEDGLLKLDDTTLSEILRTIPNDMLKTFKSRKQAQGNADDLTDNLSDSCATQAIPELLPQSYLLSDPEAQNRTIEEMLNKYNTINTKVSSSEEAEITLFRDFITESFYKICEKFKCSSVNFTVRKDKGRADISALPEGY